MPASSDSNGRVGDAVFDPLLNLGGDEFGLLSRCGEQLDGGYRSVEGGAVADLGFYIAVEVIDGLARQDSQCPSENLLGGPIVDLEPS